VAGGNRVGGQGATATVRAAPQTSGTAFASSVGVRRAPAFTTDLGFAMSPAPAAQLQADVRGAFTNGALPPGLDSVRHSVEEGGVVVLRGEVASDRDRQLAEAITRLTPGVMEVRNELVSRPSASPTGGYGTPLRLR